MTCLRTEKIIWFYIDIQNQSMKKLSSRDNDQCLNSKFFLFILLVTYLFIARDLSLETDKMCPSIRLLLYFLVQNNKIYIV